MIHESMIQGYGCFACKATAPVDNGTSGFRTRDLAAATREIYNTHRTEGRRVSPRAPPLCSQTCFPGAAVLSQLCTNLQPSAIPMWLPCRVAQDFSSRRTLTIALSQGPESDRSCCAKTTAGTLNGFASAAYSYKKTCPLHRLAATAVCTMVHVAPAGVCTAGSRRVDVVLVFVFHTLRGHHITTAKGLELSKSACAHAL